jgi:glycosyltransferase involved in cell wall biosynthesis
MVLARVRNPAVTVSVIVPYYDKSSTLVRCVEALLNQSDARQGAEALEVIVVDDGSRDDDIHNRLPERVVYIWQRKHLYGLSRARNTGAKLANGRYLVFLDPDLLVCSTFVTSILDGFDRFGDRIIQTGYLVDFAFEGAPDPRAAFGVWNRPDQISSRWVHVAGSNLAISRALFDESPGFDEDLVYGGAEDILFGYQIGRLPGTGVLFNRGMEARHIPHPPSIHRQLNPDLSWEIVREKYPDFHRAYVIEGRR